MINVYLYTNLIRISCDYIGYIYLHVYDFHIFIFNHMYMFIYIQF